MVEACWSGMKEFLTVDEQRGPVDIERWEEKKAGRKAGPRRRPVAVPHTACMA
jgi:hypothetical protein